jgi:3-oxoacyl-[acyl-carrier-protein] synthase-1
MSTADADGLRRVVVAGLGARTSIGASAAASAAAVRAGIAGFGQHPFMIDTAGKRMIVASAPYIGMDVVGSERLAELAGPAAAEAATPLAVSPHKAPPLPLFLGLPPARPGRDHPITAVEARVKSELERLGLSLGTVTPIETGHAAGVAAMQAAWRLIRSGGAAVALAGGVDSYLQPETLEWLEANDQLLSAGPTNNPYGFIPGEAGGFTLLLTLGAAEALALDVTMELVALESARESKVIKTDAVCIGEGLTDLFRQLASHLQADIKVDDLYCDMNGEPYRADEFGFASVRAGAMFRAASDFIAPADCWGDVGAASGPLFVVLSAAAARRGYASGPLAGAFTSSESGERVGFVARSVVARP